MSDNDNDKVNRRSAFTVCEQEDGLWSASPSSAGPTFIVYGSTPQLAAKLCAAMQTAYDAAVAGQTTGQSTKSQPPTELQTPKGRTQPPKQTSDQTSTNKRRKRRVVIPQHRWKPRELALLGTMPDHVLAKKLGRTLSSVKCKRSLERIKAYRMGQKRRSRIKD